MTQENYVTRDIAEDLKKKGYREKCRAYYYNGLFSRSCSHNTYNSQNDDSLIDAPSLAEAAKWLREKHRVSVEPIFTSYNGKWDCGICRMRIGEFEYYNDKVYDSYESALNDGIREVLKDL